MKRIQFAILSVFVVISSFSQTPISQLIDHPALKHASVGVCVKDLETGGVIVSHNGDKSLTPASVMKLVTTATAFEIFGADYRYTTLLALDATNPNRILVIGSGDPTLGSDVFGGNPYELLSDWTKKIFEKNDKEKVWQIYVADELFGYDGISPEWTWIDMGNYYASGTYGISIFDNSYKIFFDTTDPNSCPKIIRTDPEMKSIRFTNFLKTNTSGRDNGYIYGIPFRTIEYFVAIFRQEDAVSASREIFPIPVCCWANSWPIVFAGKASMWIWYKLPESITYPDTVQENRCLIVLERYSISVNREC